MGWESAGAIRVASVPAGHVYVRHIGPPAAPDGSAADGVSRLVDPRPCGAPSDGSVWWPPVMLDPGWVRSHHETFDVFHIHFGFDAQAPDDLRALVAELDAHGKPLVYTVHDLRNPHHADPAAHDAHLDVLVPAAAELITMTPGAAAVIARRWGRTAEVLPHPHVVGLDLLESPRARHEDFVVGVHLKSLRANMDPLPVLRALGEVVPELPGAVLRVDVHPDVLEPDHLRHDAPLVEHLLDAERQGTIQLRVHDFFSDEQLWTYLRDELDVSVLPYRFGTHSGWLEACHDLGTVVLAPDCGFYAEQRPCLTYGHDDVAGLDAGSLVDAVLDAWKQRPRWRAGAAERRAERSRVAAAHRDLYVRALR